MCAPFAHTVICLIVKQLIYEAGSRGSSPRTAANARSAWSPSGPCLAAIQARAAVHACCTGRPVRAPQPGCTGLAAERLLHGGVARRARRAGVPARGLGQVCRRAGAAADGRAARTACTLAVRTLCTPGPRGRARGGAAQACTAAHFEARPVGLASSPFFMCSQQGRTPALPYALQK